MFQTRYAPFVKLERARLSRMAPLVASRTVTVWDLPADSQSRLYKATRWAWPSVRFTSIVKVDQAYQVDAMRSVAAGFCMARRSLVDATQV
jgi:hypothetical protein